MGQGGDTQSRVRPRPLGAAEGPHRTERSMIMQADDPLKAELPKGFIMGCDMVRARERTTVSSFVQCAMRSFSAEATFFGFFAAAGAVPGGGAAASSSSSGGDRGGGPSRPRPFPRPRRPLATPLCGTRPGDMVCGGTSRLHKTLAFCGSTKRVLWRIEAPETRNE